MNFAGKKADSYGREKSGLIAFYMKHFILSAKKITISLKDKQSKPLKKGAIELWI
jgi:hypothetical protein